MVPGSDMCEWVWGMGEEAEGESEQSGEWCMDIETGQDEVG